MRTRSQTQLQKQIQTQNMMTTLECEAVKGLLSLRKNARIQNTSKPVSTTTRSKKQPITPLHSMMTRNKSRILGVTVDTLSIDVDDVDSVSDLSITESDNSTAYSENSNVTPRHMTTRAMTQVTPQRKHSMRSGRMY